MSSFRHTIDIAATPEQVWQVLGDLTSVDRWIPGVTSVTRTDTGRLCTFDDGHIQDEQILDYSPQTRSYRYVIEGAPLPVATTPAASPWKTPAARPGWCGSPASSPSTPPRSHSSPRCGSPTSRWSWTT